MVSLLETVLKNKNFNWCHSDTFPRFLLLGSVRAFTQILYLHNELYSRTIVLFLLVKEKLTVSRDRVSNVYITQKPTELLTPIKMTSMSNIYLILKLIK